MIHRIYRGVAPSAITLHVMAVMTPGRECTGQMALFIDDNFVVDGIANVPAATPDALARVGWASVAANWLLNDGLPHQIRLLGRQLDCDPNVLQMIRPYLSVTSLKR